jgi:hypothetical protein
MRNWDGLDIRRNLPEYVLRDGDDVYSAPYRATRADLDAYVLGADTRALQALVDAQLNACCGADRPSLLGSQCGLHFSCVDPWVVFLYAALRRITSVTEPDNGFGFLSAFELSIWVPVVKRHSISAVIAEEPVWFLPLVYTYPTSSVATGREVYGFPKVPASFQIEEGFPVAVETRHGSAQDPRQTVLKRHFRAPPHSDHPADDLPRSKQPLVAQVVRRYLANQAVVFRKQAGPFLSGNSARARYSALIELRMPISRLHGIRWSECPRPFSQVPETVSLKLGLSPSQRPLRVSLRDSTIDILQGREIWVSKVPVPLVAPLAAFDQEPAPALASVGSQDGVAPADLEPCSAPLRRIQFRGSGEAYCVRARPRAIASLLAKHFPNPRGPQQVDVDRTRDFVILMFSSGADDAGVPLREFGVWVPIRHRERPAWYLPYLFRSPGAAVIHAREWLGHPCQEGTIRYEPDQTERSVDFWQPVRRAAPGVEWRESNGIELKLVAPGGVSASEPCSPEGLPHGLLTVVGLRQVRHATDTTRACIQEVIISELDIRTCIDDSRLYRRLHLFGHLQLHRLLDLDGERAIVPGWSLDPLVIQPLAQPEPVIHEA